MLVQDAQREVRTIFVGGFWGQLVCSVIWSASAGVGVWVSPRGAILTVVIGGFFIYPATKLLLRLSGGRASLPSGNPLRNLAIQIALALPMIGGVALFIFAWAGRASVQAEASSASIA